MEEYFLNYMLSNKISKDKDGRTYIPILWTNFQIEYWFKYKKQEMQQILDMYVQNHPSHQGYFTIVQHDDGPMLKLPSNTVIYGACTGSIPLPLIYEDRDERMISLAKQNSSYKYKKSFHEKLILCSFVGTTTHQIRKECVKLLSQNKSFEIHTQDSWSSNVNKDLQNLFIEKTIQSKFALAPRGYGRSSFRFFEILKLGTIPIYIWDDIEWLPYLEFIDYQSFCISIHQSEIIKLPEILFNIGEHQYNQMLENYEKIKHMFELEYMCNYITKSSQSQTINEENNNLNPIKISLCITTMNRFHSFLSTNLDKYLEFLNNNIIDEIIISDENGDDYNKIQNKYKDVLQTTPNFKVYKNPQILGVLKNKIKCCSYASNKYIALIDSDNFADENYFIEAKNYISKHESQFSNHIILAPSKSINHNNAPNLNYKIYEGKILKKSNIKSFLQQPENMKLNYAEDEQCDSAASGAFCVRREASIAKLKVLLNTGNYILSKNIIENIMHDQDNEILKIISGCDVMYFNLLALKQFPNLEIHVIKDMEYYHTEHNDGEFNKRDPRCDIFKEMILMNEYYNLQ